MGLEGEEKGAGHPQPPGCALGSDHLILFKLSTDPLLYIYMLRADLENHLPAVSADIELGSQHGLSAAQQWTNWQGGGTRRGRSARCNVRKELKR